jgi:DNA-binding response OmpR family regulator
VNVAVVRWPSEAALRTKLARAGRPCLLLVEPDGVPPVPDADGVEDWARDDADPIELYVRCERLRRRAAARLPPVLDGDGLVWRGERWVALSAFEAVAAAPLLANLGAVVSRAELLAHLRPGAADDEMRVVDRAVRRLRHRLAPLGLRVRLVRSVGFLLEADALPG